METGKFETFGTLSVSLILGESNDVSFDGSHWRPLKNWSLTRLFLTMNSWRRCWDWAAFLSRERVGLRNKLICHPNFLRSIPLAHTRFVAALTSSSDPFPGAYRPFEPFPCHRPIPPTRRPLPALGIVPLTRSYGNRRDLERARRCCYRAWP